MDFDTLKNRVTELAQGGVAKAKQLTEIAKLKINSASEQDAIRKAYAELGKLYFAERGLDPDPAYAALCAKIVESREHIAYNEERIADIKRAGDVTDADIEAVSADIDLDADLDVPAEEDKGE